jgi:hypothetical protein
MPKNKYSKNIIFLSLYDELSPYLAICNEAGDLFVSEHPCHIPRENMPDAETIPYGETQTRCSVYPNLAILFKEIEEIAKFATYCETAGSPLPKEFNSVAELRPCTSVRVLRAYTGQERPYPGPIPE